MRTESEISHDIVAIREPWGVVLRVTDLRVLVNIVCHIWCRPRYSIRMVNRNLGRLDCITGLQDATPSFSYAGASLYFSIFLLQSPEDF